MKKADNFNATKWLVENKITTQSRLTEAEKLIYVEWDELEKMAFAAISAYNKQNGLDPIQSVRVTSSGNSYDKNKAVQANVTVKTNTGEEMDYGLTWDKDLNLSKLTPPYKSTNTPQPNKKQKDGDSKPISLTPIQKKEFKSAIRDLKKIEDLEYALGEAGNVLANILTNGEAEYIEDVENFGYDADEVEQYAMDLAGGSKLNEGIVSAPLANILWKLNPKVKEWENISSTKEALSFIKSLTNEELNNLYVWRLGFDIPQSEDEKIKNLLDLIDNKIGESKLDEVENKSVLDFVKQNLDSVMGEISNITGGNSYYKELAKMVKSNPALMSGDENLVQFKDDDGDGLGLYNTFQVAFNRNKITDGGFKSKIVVDGTKLFITA